jgi:pheromone shutdown protein TraB
MKNEFFKVIHMAALANVGVMTATFLAIYIIWQCPGLINPADLLKSIL